MPRLFVALRVPPNPVLERVLASLQDLRGVRPVAPGNLHYTLRFLGDVDTETKTRFLAMLREAHIDQQPFSVHIVGTGAFPKPSRPRVIWAGCAPESGDELVRLAGHVDEFTKEAGLGRRDKPFVPHLTLARVKTQGGRGLEVAVRVIREERATSYGRTQAGTVHLVESTLTPGGPRYQDLLEVPLR